MTTRTTLTTALFAAALALALGAPSASAQPASSPHEATAAAAYEAGDLETALREFEAAYLDTKRPDLLYVIARLHGERKDCTKAIDFYQRYLATKPGQTQADAAQTEITKCQAILDAQRPPDPPPSPPDTTTTTGGGGDTSTSTSTAGGGGTTATTMTASTSDGSRPLDKVGLGLLVGGLVAEGAAVVLYVQARNAQCGDPVCTELTYDEYLDAEDKAKKLRLTSIIVAGAGAVLVGAGVYRFATRGKRRSGPALSLVPTGDGAAVTFSGRF